jgi:hypothetical protein
MITGKGTEEYNRRKFEEFCDQAADIARQALILDTHEDALGQVLCRMRHLFGRAVARGMNHDQLDAIARACARSFEDGQSRLTIKREGGL